VVAALQALAGPAQADEPGTCEKVSPDSSKLVVGDSLTYLYGWGCDLFPDRWDVNAKVGRNAAEGAEVLRGSLRNRYRRVIFDLGTNDADDPAGYRSDLRDAFDLIGDRPMTLVTVWTDRTGLDPAAINRQIEGFASAHPQRVSVVDWGQYLKAHPELLAPDGVHLTSEGYELRRGMLVDQVRELRARHRRR
jgi:hypothetical protein